METFLKFFSKVCVSGTIHLSWPNLAKIRCCEVAEKSSRIADKTRSPATAGTANRSLLFLEHRIPMPEFIYEVSVLHFTRVLEAGKYGFAPIRG